MSLAGWIPFITIGATLLLVLTGLLNFSVFVRQLRASNAQLDTARKQLESSQLQPEIQLVQRAMAETSDHLKLLVARPYLRPYFYENQAWAPGDTATSDEVKSMAELLLNNFASAIIHAAAFPQYPVRSIEQTIRIHLRSSPALRNFLIEGFDRFQLAGLALLYLKNETRDGIEQDLAVLIAEPGQSDREKVRRQRLLAHVRVSADGDALQMAKYGLEDARILPNVDGRIH